MINKIKLWLISSLSGKYLAKGAKALAAIVTGVLIGWNVPPETAEGFSTSLEALLIVLGQALIVGLG